MRLSFRRATGADIGLRHKQVRLCGGRLARYGALETANCLGELALFAGEVPVVMGTESRGASNEKAKRELSWRPRYVSWREGVPA